MKNCLWIRLIVVFIARKEGMSEERGGTSEEGREYYRLPSSLVPPNSSLRNLVHALSTFLGGKINSFALKTTGE
jgi:hypothetical protein